MTIQSLKKVLPAFIVAAVMCTPAVLHAQTAEEHSITRDFLMGRTHYEQDSCFVAISREYTKLELQYSYIQKATYAAYIEMQQAAQKDSVTLTVTSASRNFWVQKYIWEQRWLKNRHLNTAERLTTSLQYISMPGTSRHHWGTDMDFCSKELEFWKSETGKKTYRWLVINAGRFGFFQPYTSRAGGRTGYEEEKWHWSYAPLADKYLEAYLQMIGPEDIVGFAGAEEAAKTDIIGRYVCGIENNYIPLVLEVKNAWILQDPLYKLFEKD